MFRRQFLQRTLSLGGLTLMNQMIPYRSFAQLAGASEPHFLLVLRLNGGIDTMLSTDAMDFEELQKRGLDEKDVYFFDERKPVEKIGANLIGPALMPLKPHLSEIAIINGLMMNHNDSGHETNRTYMVSGTNDIAYGFGPFQVAKAIKESSPFGVAYHMEYERVNTGGYIKTLPISSLTTANNQNTDQMNYDQILFDKALADGNDDIGRLIETEMKYAEQVKVLNEINTSLFANTLVGEDEFMKRIVPFIGGFGAGVIQGGSCDFANDGELDTHSNHQVRHTQTLTAAFDRVAKIIQLLKETEYRGPNANGKKSLFDLTTVLVMSEFARTASLDGGTNDSTGHNQLNNTCLLFGKNIKGNQFVGKSHVFGRSETQDKATSILQGHLFDFTQARHLTIDEMIALKGMSSLPTYVDFIYPESIWRTIAKAFGVTSAADLPGLNGGFAMDSLLK